MDTVITSVLCGTGLMLMAAPSAFGRIRTKALFPAALMLNKAYPFPNSPRPDLTELVSSIH